MAKVPIQGIVALSTAKGNREDDFPSDFAWQQIRLKHLYKSSYIDLAYGYSHPEDIRVPRRLAGQIIKDVELVNLDDEGRLGFVDETREFPCPACKKKGPRHLLLERRHILLQAVSGPVPLPRGLAGGGWHH